MTNCTAQVRIDWRKARARSYSTDARQRIKTQVKLLQHGLENLRMFRSLVDEAPHIVLVLSDDIHCEVLYANHAIGRLLYVPAASVLGR